MNMDMKIWIPEFKEFVDVKNDSFDYYFDIDKEGTLKYFVYQDNISSYTQIEFIPCRFTGKYDKNGDKIYEGYKLKYKSEEYKLGHETPYIIFWDEESCTFACENETNFMSPSVWNEMEIVGHIFND